MMSMDARRSFHTSKDSKDKLSFDFEKAPVYQGLFCAGMKKNTIWPPKGPVVAIMLRFESTENL